VTQSSHFFILYISGFCFQKKKVTLPGDLLISRAGGLEEKASGYLHLAVGLSACDFAEA
jgi:hypothetical protein